MFNNFSTHNSPFPAPQNSANSRNSPHSGNSQNSAPLAGNPSKNPPANLFTIPPSGLLIIPDYCRCTIAELG